MKSILRILGILSVVLCFNLQAEEIDPVESFFLKLEQIDLEQDYSSVLGSKAINDFYDHFLDSLFDVSYEIAKKAEEVIAQYPEEEISQKWQKEIQQLESVSKQRTLNKKLLSFIGFGFFPHTEFLDISRLESFKVLQNQIYTTTVKELILFHLFANDKVSSDDLYRQLTNLEESILKTLVVFCEASADPFFHEDVKLCVDGKESRFDVAEQLLGIALEEDEEDEPTITTEAEKAFAELEEAFEEKIDQLIEENLSKESLDNLISQCQEDEVSVLCKSECIEEVKEELLVTELPADLSSDNCESATDVE